MTKTQTPEKTALPHPPSAPGLPILGSALAFRAAKGIPVEFIQKTLRTYGDIVHITVTGRNFYLIGHPDLAHEIFLKRVNEFHKAVRISKRPIALSRFLGHGILIVDHDQWKPQHKLIQPLMHAKHIERYADTMSKFGEQMISRWQDGAVRDIHADMTQVTMWIIAETMFGMNVDQTPHMQRESDAAQQIAVYDFIAPMPRWLTPHRDREAQRVNNFLTGLVQQFMAERRAQGHVERHDLLSLLMDTRDEDGNPMPDRFIRDNILTLFFAGHETTANTLTWAFYYLAQNPVVLAALHREVDTVLAGRIPTLADLPNLPYTLMVIKETMRLQPIVSALPRAILKDTELGGYQLNGQSLVFTSPYVLHRDPRWWEDPEQFSPSRFSPENEAKIHKYAYMPFGAGPRICIGNHFALMEAQILLSMMVSRYTLHLEPGQTVEAQRQITTSPKGGLPMRLARR